MKNIGAKICDDTNKLIMLIGSHYELCIQNALAEVSKLLDDWG